MLALLIVSVALAASLLANALLFAHAWRTRNALDEAWEEGLDEGLARAALVAVFWRARGDALASATQFWAGKGLLPKAVVKHFADASKLAKDAIRHEFGDFDVPEDVLIDIAHVAREVGVWAERETRPAFVSGANGRRPGRRQPAPPPPPEEEPEWLLGPR